MFNYFFKNLNTLFLTCALAFISIANAQEVRVIDNKGTIKTINNNKVTTGAEPTDPLEGDVWASTNLTDNNLSVWDGSSWIYVTKPSSSATYSIGDVVNGGVVFWIDSTGQHGLVVAFSDARGSGKRQWGCNVINLPNVPDVPNNTETPVGVGAEIGDGFNNTNDILTNCPTAPAALAARSLGAQWFLPSAKELNQMYINKSTLEAISGFTKFDYYYWSSTEYGDSKAWLQYFGGSRGPRYKHNFIKVRPVRAF